MHRLDEQAVHPHPKRRWAWLSWLSRRIANNSVFYRSPLRLVRYCLALSGIGPRGVRIVHLSDLHVRDLEGEWVSELMAILGSLSPDVLLLTGDYAYSYSWDPLPATVVVSWIARRFEKAEIFAVAGNSDHPRALERIFRATGVRLLVNEGQLLQLPGGRLWVGGVDDPHHSKDDPALALRGRPEGVAAVLLAHSPDVLLRPQSLGADLVVVGHTHGGQVCLPGLGPLVTKTRIGRKFTGGLYRKDGTWVVVSRGLGGVPLRVRCPREVVVIELVGEDQQG